MNDENIIRTIVQKAQENSDEYLSNEALVRMIMNKNVDFNKEQNKAKIKDFLDILASIKEEAQLSKRS